MNDRPTRARRIAVAAALVSTLCLLAGCSDGLRDAARSPIERSASDGSCPYKASFDWTMQIRNLLPDPVRLEASSVDCYDWSGWSTPVNVFKMESVRAGQLKEFMLVPADGPSKNWTLSFWIGRTYVASARFSIPSIGVRASPSEVVTWDTNLEPRGKGPDAFWFSITKLAKTDLPDTPGIAVASLIDDDRSVDLGANHTVGIIVLDGYISLAMNYFVERPWVCC